MGYQALQWLGIDDLSTVERSVWSMMLGLGFLSCLGFILALFGLVYQSLAVFVLAILSVALYRNIIHLLKDSGQLYKRLRDNIEGSFGFLTLFILTLMVFILLVIYVKALAPEMNFDALNYQLPIPMMYIENHGLIEIPFSFRSYLPRAISMQFMLGLLIGGEPTAILFSTAAVATLTLATFSFGHRILKNTRLGLIAAALLISIPALAWQASTAYIDGGLALFAFSAVYAMFKWRHNKSMGWSVLIGAMIGLAMFSKPQAAFLMVPLLAVIVIELRPWDKLDFFAKHLMWILVPALILGAPWYFIVYLWTGNPAFPMFNAFFKSPYWTYQNAVFTLRQFGMGYDIFSLLKLPWNLSFHSNFFHEGGRGYLGILPMIAVLYPIASFGRVGKRREISLLIILVLSSALSWALVAQYIRFYLLAMPLIALLAASTIEDLLLKHQHLPVLKQVNWSGWIPAGFLIAILLVNMPFIVTNVWNFQPLDFVLRGASREEYLSRYRPNYEGYKFLADYSDLSPVVLSDGFDFITYQPVAQHYPLSDSFLKSLFLPLSKDDPGRLAKYLNTMGITHIVTNLLTWDAKFTETYLLPEFSSKGYTVYRLIPGGYTRSSVPVLENGSFEIPDGDHPMNWRPIESPDYVCDGLAAYHESCHVVVDGPNYYSQELPAKPEQIFHYVFFARTDNEDGSIRFQINWRDKKGELLDTYAASTTLVDDWRGIQGYAISPPGTASAVVYFLSNNDAEIAIDKSTVSQISVLRHSDIDSSSLQEARIPSVTLWHRIFSCVNSSDKACLDFLSTKN